MAKSKVFPINYSCCKFYPMAELLVMLAGDKAEVFVLVPDGAEALIGSRLHLIYLVSARHKFSFITV